VIKTQIPDPESLPILETLRAHEPGPMSGQPAIVWESAQGCLVKDRWAIRARRQRPCWHQRRHGRKQIADAIIKTGQFAAAAQHCFPNEPRAALGTYT